MLRAAVVGVGHLGRFHAQKYHSIEQVELVAVVDILGERARSVAAECGCKAYSNYQDLPNDIDIVSIAADTHQHYRIAKDLLLRGQHVLIEKPICTNSHEGLELIEIAKNKNRLIQIGHVERFNPAFIDLKKSIQNPQFIECTRIAPFTTRSSNVDVVLDIMIHDIDLVIDLVGEQQQSVTATGGSMVTNGVDIASTRIHFDHGCVANVTASRISEKTVREFKVFQKGSYMLADMQQKSLRILRLGKQPSQLSEEVFTYSDAQCDSLKKQIIAYVDSVANNKPALVSGEDGYKALMLAKKISDEVLHSINRFTSYQKINSQVSA